MASKTKIANEAWEALFRAQATIALDRTQLEQLRELCRTLVAAPVPSTERSRA